MKHVWRERLVGELAREWLEADGMLARVLASLR